MGNIAGERFERSRRSEVNLEILTAELGANNWENQASRSERVKDWHKNDRNKTFNFNFEIRSSNVITFQIGQGTSAQPRFRLYAATYEYDWYSWSRPIEFPVFQTRTPRLRINRKGDHEHYTIMVIPQCNWCVDRLQQYSWVRGYSLIHAAP